MSKRVRVKYTTMPCFINKTKLDKPYVLVGKMD